MRSPSDAMSTRSIPLGRLGPPVSRIGLGLAALGRPGYVTAGHDADVGADKSVEAMRRRAHAVLDAAWARGVRYFDAARSYGRAEDFLASWLASRALESGAPTIGSKWGYRYTAGWRARAEVHEIKSHSLAMLLEQVDESRRLLGAHLTLYQIHSATLESGVLDDADVLDALARLRDDGLVIGLSLSGARQADTLGRALAIERDGAPLFGCVQATWNLLEPSVGPMLTDAHGAGMGVIVKEALANGYLVARGENDVASDVGANPFEYAARTLAREAHELGIATDTLALAAVLAQPWVDCVLSGAVRVEHLDTNLAALGTVVPPEVMDRLRSLAVPAEEYWRRRGALAWS